MLRMGQLPGHGVQEKTMRKQGRTRPGAKEQTRPGYGHCGAVQIMIAAVLVMGPVSWVLVVVLVVVAVWSWYSWRWLRVVVTALAMVVLVLHVVVEGGGGGSGWWWRWLWWWCRR